MILCWPNINIIAILNKFTTLTVQELNSSSFSYGITLLVSIFSVCLSFFLVTRERRLGIPVINHLSSRITGKKFLKDIWFYINEHKFLRGGLLAIVGLLIICLIVIFLSIFIFSKYTGEIVSVTLGTFMLNLVILGMALKIGNNDSFVGAIGTESEKGNDQLNEYLKLLLLKKYQKGKISRRNLSLLMQSSDDDCMIKMKIIKELIIKITCQQLLEDKNKNNDINAVYNNFLRKRGVK